MIKKYLNYIGVLIMIIALLPACSPEELYEGKPKSENMLPVLKDFSPLYGTPGTEITLRGENFGLIKNIQLGAVEVPFEIKSSTSLSFKVPVTGNFETSSHITLSTDSGRVVSQKVFNISAVKTIEVSKISPKSASSSGVVNIQGFDLGSVSEVRVDGIEVLNIQVISDNEINITLAYNLTPGPAVIALTNANGTTYTNEMDFYIIEYLSPDFNEDWEGPLEDILWSAAEDAENDPNKSGFSTGIAPYALLPNPIDGRFCTLGGISDVTDSGSYCGQMRMLPVPEGTFSEFFKEGNPNLDQYFFNVQINFQGLPSDYPVDDPLAGLRVRFEDSFIDIDGDGSTSDQFVEYRPTLFDLEAKEFVPNQDGWHSISIPFSNFIHSGESGGSWDTYDITDQITRFAIVSRRTHDGEFSLSIDNLSITKGGPVFFSNLDDFILSNKD